MLQIEKPENDKKKKKVFMKSDMSTTESRSVLIDRTALLLAWRNVYQSHLSEVGAANQQFPSIKPPHKQLHLNVPAHVCHSRRACSETASSQFSPTQLLSVRLPLSLCGSVHTTTQK